MNAQSHPQSPPDTDASAQKATLPISMSDGLSLDPEAARAIGASLHTAYTTAKPYHHIVIDDFLPTALTQQLLDNFPPSKTETSAAENALNYSGIQVKKRQIYPYDTNEFCRNAFAFFNAAPFLQFLEELTGIDGLIPDPYFHGGGFHEISRGGKLGVHADFRIHEQLHLQRRLNVLIYLNQDWPAEYGGELEIWDQSMQQKCASIAPIFNRCVVFNTDAKSYHGHPEPLNCPENRTRKSIALYYYTASQGVYQDLPSDSTMYVARPGEDAHSRKMAAKLRLQNHLKDFLPPILFRALRQLKQRS
jgi:Rps23 Pro-64 3,4-dihydroxylase Tpa1-like proline 4-hydroxylase